MSCNFIHRYIGIGAVAVLVLCLTSCVKETLCESEHPHKSWVSFSYDWNNLTEHRMILPDSMFILVDRVVDQHVSSIGYNTHNGTGMYLRGIPMLVDLSQNHDISKFPIYSGEYKFLTLNLSSDNFDYTEMYRLMNSTLNTSLSNIEIAYKTYSAQSLLLDRPFGGWMDVNQYSDNSGRTSGFVLTERAPVVIDSTTITKWEEGDSKTIGFKPTTITQNIDVFFDIKKDIHDVSFVIDSVFAVISGIPHKVNLSTGGLDISSTDKMIFKTQIVDASRTPNEYSASITDTPSNTTVRCYKNITVLGIVENDDMESDLYAGPGVMQLIIYSKVFGAGASNNPTYRKMTGLVNIHKSLANAKLQAYDPNLHLYHKTREHSDLYVALDLTINKAMLMGTDDGGIVKWNEKDVPGEYDIY